MAQEGIILTDRGTEYCGKAEQHDYQLYRALNDIDHTRTKAKSSQTNGICERFHRTILNEFYQVTFRKKLYADIESPQQDLDEWLLYYEHIRERCTVVGHRWPHWKTRNLEGKIRRLNLT